MSMTITSEQKKQLQKYSTLLNDLRHLLRQVDAAKDQCEYADVDFDEPLDVTGIQEMVHESDREVDALVNLDVKDEDDDTEDDDDDEGGEDGED
jgi:hypothetical protein